MKRIFLSHSGRDAQQAVALAAHLGQAVIELNRGAVTVEVFNTSDPAHRFAELKARLRGGDDWRAKAQEYDGELRGYLMRELESCLLYLLLVTPTSARANSSWIQFEMETAHGLATGEQRRRFLPCLAEGAQYADLPTLASQFQAIDLNRADGIRVLAKSVLDLVAEG